MDDCIIWPGRVSAQGYGAFGKNGRAHRDAYEKRHGAGSARGRLVCHSCDNRRCVNPDHLFLGTHLDNNLDMVAKGRHVPTPGEKSGMAKLTDAIVLEIRASSLKSADLARFYGVGESTICAIRKRKTWKHLP